MKNVRQNGDETEGVWKCLPKCPWCCPAHDISAASIVLVGFDHTMEDEVILIHLPGTPQWICIAGIATSLPASLGIDSHQKFPI
jgi:hypothetical protein